ncbi:MAG: DUF3592 domain-containing protein [Planctomycetota bacterium]
MPKLFLLSGSVLTVVGLVMCVRTVMFLSVAESVDAVVVGNEKSYSDDGNPLYQPTFRFTDMDGSEQTVRLGHSGSEYDYIEGETVPIIFDPNAPSAIRVDSFFGIWFFTLEAVS